VILSSQRLWPSLWSTLVGFIISSPSLSCKESSALLVLAAA
jgi:hypothetical protein